MAAKKIRAYKLAEELGIERQEFVDKAKTLGIELRSAMASLEDDQVELLREKLGTRSKKAVVTEKRVERKGGAAVIRRRKKAAPPPPPEPVAVEPEPVAPFEEPVPETPPVEAETAPEPEVEEARPEATPTPTPAPASRPSDAPPPSETRGPAGGKAPPGKAGRQRKLVREVVNLREQERLARQATGRTLARRQITIDPRSMSSPRRRRRDALQKPVPAAKASAASKEAARVVRVSGGIAVGELAREMGVKAPEVQKRLMALGTMASINQSIDVETAGKVAAEFGFQVQDVGFREEEFFETEVPAEGGAPRPPVITVMGHVDHGKTSLLDALRRTKVVEGEAGGITQHIGAYQVTVDDKTLTFIDTPGHAAFTSMRARGAQATDIVVLVVAATEGVMPQTVEAIAHAKAAGVPILVAVNKIDLPGANSQQIRQRLMEHELVPEEFGGDIICVDVSAKTGAGLDKLLEMLALQSEVLELKADPKRRASGVVLEARLDKGRGPLATVLVQNGTLRPGDVLVVGTCQGRVRALEDENGERVKEAGPSTPVQVIGLSGVPEAGQEARAVESDRDAREVVDHRLAAQRSQPADGGPRRVSLDEFFAEAEGGGPKELPIVLKGDVHGSVEAVRDALLKLSTDSVKVNVIHAGVGAISETDVMLAKASEALIFGFGVRPDPTARRAAEGQGVEVHSHRIIYELTDYVRQRMAGLLPPTETEKFLGRAEVRQTFTVPKVGTIAGCYVAEGLIRRNARCRLLRDGAEIYAGRIGSLKRFKDDAREVASGFECGIGIEGFNDVKIGDQIEVYEVESRAPTLE